MNAAVRAVVRTGIDRGFEICGIRRGYAGLIEGIVVVVAAAIYTVGGRYSGKTR